MKRINRTAAAIALGFACAMPVMAQGSGSAGSSQASQPAQTAQQSAPDTRSMGAGPAMDDNRMARSDGDRDLGWLGLLGLLGLMGLKRRHHHDDRDTMHRADNRRANTY